MIVGPPGVPLTKPERADQLAVIGARHPAGTKLPQNVLTKILSQFGPLPHILQEAPRMAEIGLPRAGRVAAQAHFLIEPLDAAVDEARPRGCLRAWEGGWVLALGWGLHLPPTPSTLRTAWRPASESGIRQTRRPGSHRRPGSVRT